MVNWTDIDFGTSIRFIYSGVEYDGTFIHLDGDVITIKLSNGYNIALRKDKVTLAGIVAAASASEEVKHNGKTTTDLNKQNGAKRVSLLATGGTISSKVDYKTGAVSPSEDISFISDRVKDVHISTETIDNILSENVTPDKWVYMAGKIRDGLNRNDGCVVFHGTDTMSYSAAAISFIFSQQTGPIIFVGSQRSSDRPSSDAFMNAEGAIHVATSDFGEVGIAMHRNMSDKAIAVNRAVRSRKMHSSRRDAFRSIGEKEVGTYVSGSVKFNFPYKKIGPTNELKTKLDPAVSILYFYPSMSSPDFDMLIENKKAVIIMGTGLGHLSHDLIPSISEATKNGKKVMMTTQCLDGAVNLNVYSTGRELLRAGVIPLGNMLPEVALVKAMYVLGNYEDEDFGKVMRQNLRGEIIDREPALEFNRTDE